MSATLTRVPQKPARPRTAAPTRRDLDGRPLSLTQPQEDLVALLAALAEVDRLALRLAAVPDLATHGGPDAAERVAAAAWTAGGLLAQLEGAAPACVTQARHFDR